MIPPSCLPDRPSDRVLPVQSYVLITATCLDSGMNSSTFWPAVYDASHISMQSLYNHRHPNSRNAVLLSSPSIIQPPVCLSLVSSKAASPLYESSRRKARLRQARLPFFNQVPEEPFFLETVRLAP